MDNPFSVLDQRLAAIELNQKEILEFVRGGKQKPTLVDDELLGIPEVATLTHSSEAAVRGWIRREEITVYKPGRRILIRRGDAMAKVFNAKRKSKLERQQAVQAFKERSSKGKKK